jgi:transmembrane sensor
MIKLRNTAHELDEIQQEAVIWVQRLASGQATVEDAAALKRWRATSPQHVKAFAEASQAWSDVASVGRDMQRDGPTATETLSRLRRQSVNRRAFIGGGVATAAAVTYGVVNPPLSLWPSLSQMRADYRTATGEQRSITLAGDVAVRLNTQTSIALRAADGWQDRVELVSGEASFGLHAAAERQFAVLAADGKTVANSAQFEVRHLTRGGDSAVYVTCFDGGVNVEFQGRGARLRPGQQLRYDAGGLDTVTAIDPESASNWSRGIVVFRATPLQEAIDEINRYRPGRIVLMSAALVDKRITGRFRIDQMDSILTRLEQAVDARIRILPGGVALLS